MGAECNCRICCFLPRWGFWEINSSHQALKQVSLSAPLSHNPKNEWLRFLCVEVNSMCLNLTDMGPLVSVIPSTWSSGMGWLNLWGQKSGGCQLTKVNLLKGWNSLLPGVGVGSVGCLQREAFFGLCNMHFCRQPWKLTKGREVIVQRRPRTLSTPQQPQVPTLELLSQGHLE